MLKLIAKLALLTLSFAVFGMFLSSNGKVEAASGCPNDFQDAQNNLHWGVNTGGHTGDMAGLIVHAYDADNGQNLITQYHLRSGIPNNQGNYQNPYPGQTPNGTHVNLNDRIFRNFNGLPAGWENDPTNRTDDFAHSTQPFLFGGCNGWSAFGPGNPLGEYTGNGEVLDCGPSSNPSRFWFTNLSNPLNASNGHGANGYWSIRVYDKSGNTIRNIDHYTEGSMNFNNGFTVSNGFNTFVDMVWHPVPPEPIESALCNETKITPTAGQIKYITIRGTDNDVTSVAVGPGGSERTFNYKAVNQFVSIRRDIYHNVGSASNPNWQPLSDNTQNIHCYHASCTIKSVDNGGQAPAGKLIAGQQFKLEIEIKNDNTDSNAQTIPSSVSGRDFSITEQAENGHGYIKNDVGFPLNPPPGPYDTGTKFLNLTAPSDITNYQLNFYPDMWGAGGGALGDNCRGPDGSEGITIPTYKPFSASGVPQAAIAPTDENPSQVSYNTKITLNSEVPVYIPTSSFLCIRQASGVQTCPDSNSGGVYGPGDTQWNGASPRAIPPGSFVAGDRYCADLHMSSYTSGLVGPGGPYDVINTTGSSVTSSCDKVTNKPYFKAKGSAASAGIAVKRPDGTCNTNSGGVLAGWNNNSGGQERGAGSDLSALALVKITGFASAQRGVTTNTGTDAAKLTFANNGSGVEKTIAAEDPALGGSFNGSGYCVNNVSPPTSGGGSTTLPAGSAYANGNVLGNQSVFVNGDVYINGNITYGAWNTSSLDNAPSFVLKASGNIYISPGVTKLDGLYMSDKNIYTCASSTGPVTGAGAYNTCKNQLVVHGNFAAEKIKLNRTFGSLRDEEPTPGSPGSPGSPGGSRGIVWSRNGAVPGMRCTATTETSEPNESTWWDNFICVPASSSLQLAWSNWENGPGSSSLGYLQANGYPYCVKWDVPADYAQTWYDNWLCANQPVGFTFTAFQVPGQDCTRVFEDSDPHGPWGAGYYLCAPYQVGTPPVLPTLPSATGPPFTNCSNRAGAIQVTTQSCAAEVFELGPELYLAEPAVEPPNDGAPPWDSATSLPPVL